MATQLNRLTATFEVLTPLYMGGAEQEGELRPPSFRGLLRFWYRAVDPKFASSNDERKGVSRETALFGGSGDHAGQSSVLLRILTEKHRPFHWDPNKAKSIAKGHGKNARNGLVYLGFPFHMGKKGEGPRSAISPGHEFRLQCTLSRGGEAARRGLAAALWLLGHAGGGGSRSRRGFGSLALKGWKADTKGSWPEIDELPLLCETSSLRQWASGFHQAVGIFKSWFGSFENGFGHPNLGPKFRAFPVDEGFVKADWMNVLNFMGRRLQEFRQRRQPDYSSVKDHLLALNRRGGAFLEYTPERASFGLPLAFRYSSLPRDARRKYVEIVPFDARRKKQLERHGSLLFLRPVSVADRLYPVFFRLDGDVPGLAPPGSVRGRTTPLSPCRRNAMDDFLSWLRTR